MMMLIHVDGSVDGDDDDNDNGNYNDDTKKMMILRRRILRRKIGPKTGKHILYEPA